MLNVGLTGGIASGKSTVAMMFREKGAYIIDFDELAHYVEEPGSPVWKAIVEYFGEGILNEDDTINRVNLGTIVFANREKMSRLNSIVHPAVFDEWKRRMEKIRKEDPHAIVISDIPLLVEVGMHPSMDVVILVYLSQEDQIKRLTERSGFSREEALKRLSSQMPINEKIPYADVVVDNGGSTENTRLIVDDVWERLKNWEGSQ